MYLSIQKINVLVLKHLTKEQPKSRADEFLDLAESNENEFVVQFILERLSLSNNTPAGVYELVLQAKEKENYIKLVNNKVSHEVECLKPENFNPYILPTRDEIRERDAVKTMKKKNQKHYEQHTTDLMNKAVKGFAVTDDTTQATTVSPLGVNTADSIRDKKVNSIMNGGKAITKLTRVYDPKILKLWRKAFRRIAWDNLLQHMHTRCSIYHWYSPENAETGNTTQDEAVSNKENTDVDIPSLQRRNAGDIVTLPVITTTSKTAAPVINTARSKKASKRRKKSFTDEYVNYAPLLKQNLYNPTAAAQVKLAALVIKSDAEDRDLVFIENSAILKHKVMKKPSAIDDIHVHENTSLAEKYKFDSYEQRLQSMKMKLAKNTDKVKDLVDSSKEKLQRTNTNTNDSFGILTEEENTTVDTTVDATVKNGTQLLPPLDTSTSPTEVIMTPRTKASSLSPVRLAPLTNIKDTTSTLNSEDTIGFDSNVNTLPLSMNAKLSLFDRPRKDSGSEKHSGHIHGLKMKKSGTSQLLETHKLEQQALSQQLHKYASMGSGHFRTVAGLRIQQPTAATASTNSHITEGIANHIITKYTQKY